MHKTMERSSCLQQKDIAPPQVFISSTFESLLKEIRDLLRTELEDVNYLPIMSELGSFQYTHGKNPVYDDTIQAVANSQIYLLIIGRHYGSIHPREGKSITELEYEEAIKSNLPVLVYINSKVWDGYGAYKGGAIADGKHGHWVDDIEVFSFIHRVAEIDANRCVFFDHAGEIINDFRKQVANLLGGYLRFELKAANWLWSEWKTRSIERTADEIWVVTPNFYWDYQDPEFRGIVFDNVAKRKITYRYLYRKTPDNEFRVSEMVRDYTAELGELWQKHVHYLPINDQDFVWCTEQILFNPFVAGRERGIIVDIMDERNKFNKYNIELGRNKRLEFRSQFMLVWNSNVMDDKSKIIPK